MGLIAIQFIAAQFVFTWQYIKIFNQWYFFLLAMASFIFGWAFLYFLISESRDLLNKIPYIQRARKLKMFLLKLWLVAHKNVYAGGGFCTSKLHFQDIITLAKPSDKDSSHKNASGPKIIVKKKLSISLPLKTIEIVD